MHACFETLHTLAAEQIRHVTHAATLWQQKMNICIMSSEVMGWLLAGWAAYSRRSIINFTIFDVVL